MENLSAKALILVSHLYSEHKITDDQRDKLKGTLLISLILSTDMIFNEDEGLLSSFESTKDESELETAIIRYATSTSTSTD